MPELPKAVRERLEAAQGSISSPHPDADTLSAFAENALASAERESVMQHLACCVECREILALSLPQEATTDIVVAAQSAKVSLHHWNVLRWAGLAAAAVTVSAAVLLYHPSTKRNQPAQSVTETVVGGQQSGRQDIASKTELTERPTAPAAALKESYPPQRREAAPPTKARDTAPHTTNETVEVAGEAGPVQSDESKPFAISAEQSRHGALAGFVAAPTKTAEAARTLAPRVVGGPQMQSVQSQSAPIQIAKAASPAPVNHPEKHELDNRLQDHADDQNAANADYSNNAANAPANIAANSANSAVANSAEFPASRAVDKAAPVEILQENSNSRTDSAAELRSLTAGSSASAMARAATVNWRISDAGNVERSIRNGAWQPMIAAKDIHFRAVATSDRSVWAGGSNGALYRSTNSGNSWSRIPVGDSGMSIAGDITHIAVRTSEEVEISTSAGQEWITRDGGRTWRLR